MTSFSTSYFDCSGFKSERFRHFRPRQISVTKLKHNFGKRFGEIYQECAEFFFFHKLSMMSKDMRSVTSVLYKGGRTIVRVSFIY